MKPALLAGCLLAALVMTVVLIGCKGKGEEAQAPDSQASPEAKAPGGPEAGGGPKAGGPEGPKTAGGGGVPGGMGAPGSPAGTTPQQAGEQPAEKAAPNEEPVTEVWAEAIPSGWVVSPENTKHIGEAGYRILHEASGIELVYAPAGTTSIGPSEPTGNRDDEPAHKVALGGFWIGLSEVTVGQWRAVMGSVPDGNDRTQAPQAAESAGAEQGAPGAGAGPSGPSGPAGAPGAEAAKGASPAEGAQGAEDAAPAPTAPPDEYPVVGVTWAEARQFCAALSMRLPTEAEWEYAARWAEKSKYPWGNEWDAAKCVNGTTGGPNAVGQLAAAGQDVSWCGAVDMAGNVREWCADWYGAGYYAASPAQAPAGPDEKHATAVPFAGKCRVARGGSFADFAPALFCRQARGAVAPTYRGLNVGLRCAADFVLMEAARPAS